MLNAWIICIDLRGNWCLSALIYIYSHFAMASRTRHLWSPPFSFSRQRFVIFIIFIIFVESTFLLPLTNICHFSNDLSLPLFLQFSLFPLHLCPPPHPPSFSFSQQRFVMINKQFFWTNTIFKSINLLLGVKNFWFSYMPASNRNKHAVVTKPKPNLGDDHLFSIQITMLNLTTSTPKTLEEPKAICLHSSYKPKNTIHMMSRWFSCPLKNYTKKQCHCSLATTHAVVFTPASSLFRVTTPLHYRDLEDVRLTECREWKIWTVMKSHV